MRSGAISVFSLLAVGLLAACGPSPAPAPAPLAAAPAVVTPPTTTPPTTTPPTTTPASTAVISGSKVGFAEAYNPLWESSSNLAADFDAIKATGATWVRFDFDWSVVQANGPTSWNWAPIDRGVAAANARGLKVLATLAYTPAWARPAGTDNKTPPTNPNDYATFANAAAARYAPQGVHTWEVWNEPNNASFWKPNPDVVAYTTLLRVAYPAIHSADAAATVLTGGTAPESGSDAPATWLQGIYANGGRNTFDAVAVHPYAGLPYGPATVAAWNTFQQTLDVHNVMVSEGDPRLIWGTEAGAFTGTATNAVSEATQAQFVTQYLQGWTNWASFTGPFFYYSLRDVGTDLTNNEDNYGLQHYDHTPKPGLAVFTSDVGP